MKENVYYGIYIKRADGTEFLAHWNNGSMAIFPTIREAREANRELIELPQQFNTRIQPLRIKKAST